jgi:predicted nucleic acid-binding protein
MVLKGELSPIFAAEALEELRAIRSIRYAFEPFSERVWELRDNLSVYDAWYVALAEWLETDLVTTDQRLMRAPGPRCPIRLLSVSRQG